MKPENIAALIEKYLNGLASPEEEKALLEWYRTQSPHVVDIPFASEEAKEKLRLSMRSKVIGYSKDRPNGFMKDNPTTFPEDNQADETPVVPTYPFKRKHTRRLLIAAALLVLLMITGVRAFILHKKVIPLSARSGTAQDIKPGSNKAILTLADGSKVVLDDASKGMVAVQGSVAIEKTADGKIIYQNSQTASSQPMYNTMETPKGGEFQLILPDGTRVWLNSSSTIRYPSVFTGNTRTVELSGEAFFEVAANPSAPFMVTAQGIRTEVLGTEFNLTAYPDEETIKTTLLTGAVRVAVIGASVGNGRLIKPGQQAVAGRSRQTIAVGPADIDQVIAWKNGVFDFDGADIATIMRQVARWYDVDIQYSGDLSGISLSGVVSRRENVDLLLEALGRTREVRFKRDGRTILVMPGG